MRTFLNISAMAAGVLTLAAMAARVILRWWSGIPFDAGLASELAIAGAIGLGTAGGLLGLAELLRYAAQLTTRLQELDHLCQEIRSTRHVVDAPAAAPPATVTQHAENAPRFDAVTRADLEEVLRLVREVRDYSLLSEDDRRTRAAHVEQDEFAAARAHLDELVVDGDFTRGEQFLADLERRYPGRPALRALNDFMQRSRADRRAIDTARSRKRVDELISISAWDRAREAVAELHDRYPDCEEAGQLAARIEREHAIYLDAQRHRMYAEIERFVSRRRWQEALAAAQTFIERFPDCNDARALQIQLPTLGNNAEVAARQEMEAEITELAKRGQYADAEALAREAIDRWPDSTQAEILRSQLERLHELATNPNAPPPRVRPNSSGPISQLPQTG